MTPTSGAPALVPSPSAAPAVDRVRQAPAAAVAAALLRRSASGRSSVSVHLASSERRADEIARALAGFAPDLDVILVPPWDCLPYDRASPSRDVMARRMNALERLASRRSGPRVVVVSPEALSQRLPPAEALAAAYLSLVRGERIDRAEVAAFASSTGYVTDDRIDEPGEIAILGEVIDVFPADAEQPVRIVLGEDDVVASIRVFDPLTQRSIGELETIRLGPASELIGLLDDQAGGRPVGAEHGMAGRYGTLASVFDLIPKAAFSQDAKASERLDRFESQVLDAFDARQTLAGLGDEIPPPPTALYLIGDALRDAVSAWTAVDLALDGVAAMQTIAGARNPGRAFCDLVAEHQAAGRRVILTGLPHEHRSLARALARGLELAPEPIADWDQALAAGPGAVLSLQVDLDAGFSDDAQAVAVIAASDVIGGRAAKRQGGEAVLLSEPELRLGDVVIHEDHGVGVLRDLETVVVDGIERDTLKLEYHDGAGLLVPVEDIGRVWRYGAEEAAVALDRLKGDAWFTRRAEVSRHIEATAASLVEIARARQAAQCAPITPPKNAYAKFAARFAFPETPDQAAAIEAVLVDLASGRPMDRLICGDVGFGKTEVALRAAAAVALSGRQVALIAPTTVLARQHVETLQRRFEGTGLRVAQLSRLVTEAEADRVREQLASGEIAIVVGTHAVAAADTRFADLGLMIIDEEQKFGAAIKSQLRELAADGHLLTLTATPIPRTLQAAMIGLQDVSVIASPPARRRPIRTFLTPYDAPTVRTALMREKRRGGQSFVVVPRIDDIEPLAEKLRALAPELKLQIAHGGLKPEVVDQVMVAFADGDGDVLLATNIIESGLDVPRANTMLIWRPDRFGLAQLHQLRGRVGRGRTQGITYLLSDPKDELSAATRSRLSTLEAFDRLGSGLTISARDLDLRGGGDLIGDEQAGHMKMIGAALYQRVLSRAVRVARGEEVEDDWTPALKLGEAGSIPTAYVPDPVVRINLYARLARLEDTAEIDDFEAEMEDRFGVLPSQAAILLAMARLQRLAHAAGARTVSAGPKGVAVTLTAARAEAMMSKLGERYGAVRKDDRLIVTGVAWGDGDYRGIERLLTALA